MPIRACSAVLTERFDALAVSNNHSGDYGREAFVETLAHLKGAGIRPFGGGANLTEAHAPLWIERRGLRIAVLGYNEFKPRSFEAGANWPGVAWSEDSQVVADIRAARKAGAHIVVPFMHWGWEHEPHPGPRQRELARRMIDAGADAVLGGHPHVTQGADVYRGRPIIWSLGNFVFDGFSSRESTHRLVAADARRPQGSRCVGHARSAHGRGGHATSRARRRDALLEARGLARGKLPQPVT